MKLKDYTTPDGLAELAEFKTETFEDGLRLGLAGLYVGYHLAWIMMKPLTEAFDKTVTVSDFLDIMGEQDLEAIINEYKEKGYIK